MGRDVRSSLQKRQNQKWVIRFSNLYPPMLLCEYHAYYDSFCFSLEGGWSRCYYPGPATSPTAVSGFWRSVHLERHVCSLLKWCPYEHRKAQREFVGIRRQEALVVEVALTTSHHAYKIPSWLIGLLLCYIGAFQTMLKGRVECNHAGTKGNRYLPNTKTIMMAKSEINHLCSPPSCDFRSFFRFRIHRLWRSILVYGRLNVFRSYLLAIGHRRSGGSRPSCPHAHHVVSVRADSSLMCKQSICLGFNT